MSDTDWERLRQFTPARIALGRAGAGLPTTAHLEFQLAHARARDAVYAELDTERLLAGLSERGLPAIPLQSCAQDRRTYLVRPDLGRQLAPQSRTLLTTHSCDIAFILTDGLSATAVNRHALPLLDALLPYMAQEQLRIAPVAVASQGRVALGDEIAATLGADLCVVLIGERPGLSAPDSLGVYLTWQPVPGVTTDAERNCISNVRSEGLAYETAALRLMYLIREARRRRLTGVALKEEANFNLLNEP